MKSIALLLAIALTACSTIADGRHQKIEVTTTPEDARCTLERQGETIGTIESTPGSVIIEKSKHDIILTCKKKGYKDVVYLNKSGIAGATFGNILLGGGIGWAIDSANGADNKYGSPMVIDMATGQVTIPKPELEENTPSPARTH